jgi:hypothetical protein
MTPKDGTACTAITPVDATDALEADKAQAGEVSSTASRSVEAQQQEYETASVKPFKPPEGEEAKKEELSWIEVELLDSQDNPVPGERYRIETPDGTVAEGTLDKDGFVRLEGIKPGTCKVSFPGYDGRSWEKKA